MINVTFNMNQVRAYELDVETVSGNKITLNAREGNVIGCYYNGNGSLYVSIEHTERFRDNIEYEFLLVQNKEEVDLIGCRFIGTAIDFRSFKDSLVIKDLYLAKHLKRLVKKWQWLKA